MGRNHLSSAPSPMAVTTMRFKDTYVKITYSQPQRQGRTIFGGLVPYNEVWRTGANEATEITLTRDLTVNGKALKAGTYSVFTIPGPDKWTIIINSDVGLWGAYNYNPKMDVMRFDIPAQSLAIPYDAFTIKLDQLNEKANWLMMWDHVQVSIPVAFTN
ncbi:MAG: DUF2911 domain-containing protein [Bacteroidia bacterium]|nr:DUF2911 domain-containing protein [Bacteroidia bacterium]